MILEPSAADAVKKAIDQTRPLWRQVGIPAHGKNGPETPSILVLHVFDAWHAIAAGSSNSVFGAGHLAAAHMWSADGCGCAVKGGTNLLDATSLAELPGFVHLHRLGLRGFDGAGPDPEACEHFRKHQSEYSAFFPVTFRRVPTSELYPWRAFRRDLPVR